VAAGRFGLADAECPTMAVSLRLSELRTRAEKWYVER
jgi:hypothetical protein